MNALQVLRAAVPLPSLRHLRKVVASRFRANLSDKDDAFAPGLLWPHELGRESRLTLRSDWRGLPPGVPHLPPGDLADFLLFIVSRYEATLLLYPPIAAVETLLDPRCRATSNAEFTELLTQSAYSRFVTDALDPEDHRFFAPVMDYPGAIWFKVDFSLMGQVTALPGIHVAPTVTLLRWRGPGQLEPTAIRIGDLLVTPADPWTWSLSRVFVLQGAAHHLIGVIHPTLHFPLDTINAVTRRRLPRGHLLRRLLEPHLRFSLALNVGVRDHARSVARNNQAEIYTPFALTEDSIWHLMRTGFRGLPGQPAYPPYRYPMGPLKINSSYGTFLSGYYRCVRRFTERICAAIPTGDDAVRAWADEIARHVPGFPTGSEIFSNGHLATATASFIHAVSVMHTADHYDYGGSDIRRSPLRVRVPPPRAPLTAPVPIEALSTAEDLFRYRMAWRMFFAPTLLRRLDQTRYRFDPAREAPLVAAAQQLLDDLRIWDSEMPCRRYVPLESISRSIEY